MLTIKLPLSFKGEMERFLFVRALLIVAHPLDNSFAKAAATRIRTTLERRGVEVDTIDLYADYFICASPAPSVAGILRRLIMARLWLGH